MATRQPRSSGRANRPSFSVGIDIDKRTALRDLRDFNKDLKRSATEMNQSLELVGKGFKLLAAGPKLIAREFREATREANTYARAVAEVTTISSEAEFPVRRIRDITFELTKLYGGRAGENAKALYQTISAGATTAAQAQDILHTANKLAIGGVTDVTTSVDALTNVVNAYSSSGARAADVSDAFFVAIRDGKTTADELARSIGQVAPIASQVGVNFDELLASVAAITKNGVATAEAFTQVRSAIVGVIKDTPKARAAAKELGIDFSVSALRAKGLKGFLQEIADSGATETQLIRLFGRVEALNAVMSLTANDGREFTSILADMANRAGSTDAAFAKMTRTLDFQVTRFDALTNAAQIALGTTATESAKAVQGLQGVNRVIEDLIAFLDGSEGKRVVDEFFDTLNTGAQAAAASLAIVVRGFGLLEIATTGNRSLSRMADQLDQSIRTLELFRQGFQDVHGELVQELAKKNVEAFQEVIATREAMANGWIEFGSELHASSVARVAQLENEIDSNREWFRQQYGYVTELIAAEEAYARALTKTDDKKKKRPPPPRPPRGGSDTGGPFSSDGSTVQGFGGIVIPIDLIEEAKLLEDTKALADQYKAFRGEQLAQQRQDESLAADIANAGIEERKQQFAELVRVGSEVTAQLIVGVAEAFGRGENVLGFIGQFVGGVIKQLGTMLIQLGTAALLAQALSAIPIFAPLVGAPGVSAAAGVALILGGATMVALGSALGASGGGGGGRGSTPRSGGGGGGGLGRYDFGALDGSPDRFRFASAESAYLDEVGRERRARAGNGAVPEGFVRSSGGAEQIVNHYHLDLRGSTQVGEPSAKVGRAFLKYIDRAERLRGRGPR